MTTKRSSRKMRRSRPAAEAGVSKNLVGSVATVPSSMLHIQALATLRVWISNAVNAGESGKRKKDWRNGQRQGTLPRRSAQLMSAEGNHSTWWTCNRGWFGGRYAPPIVYLDDTRILRAVDVRQLRRGDHLTVPLNAIRTLWPVFDFVLSYMFCLELIPVCHHTVVVDDVVDVDEQGIPRRADGEPVMIFDLSNTAHDLVDEMLPTGLLTSLPFFLFNKGVAMFIPLAEYGDAALFLKVEDGEKTEEERDAIVKRCQEYHANWDDKKFNILVENCEHTANAVTVGNHDSAQAWYLPTKSFSFALRYMPVLLAYLCNGDLSVAPIITCGAVVGESLVRFGRRMVLGLPRWKRHLSTHDLWHLGAKEIARVFITAMVPIMLLWAHQVGNFSSATQSSLVISMSPWLTEPLFALSSHLVMLLLFALSGSIWLFHPREGGSKDRLCAAREPLEPKYLASKAKKER